MFILFVWIWTFQSTLSARRATFCGYVLLFDYNNFNPRSPRGERRLLRGMMADFL